MSNCQHGWQLACCLSRFVVMRKGEAAQLIMTTNTEVIASLPTRWMMCWRIRAFRLP